jgi:hypothetical protein
MAFRGVPMESNQHLDVSDEDFGSDIDADIWDTVLSQIENQPLSEIAITDLEEDLNHGNATSSQVRALRVAHVSQQTNTRLPDLEDIMEDIQGSSPPLSVQVSNDGHPIEPSIPGRPPLVLVGGCCETNRLTPAIDSC